MMATAPAPTPLPISNPQSGAGAATAPSSGTTGSGAAPIATPAFRLFLSHLSDSVSRSLSNRRSWSELLDRSAFSRPDSLSDASFRIRKNFAYFRVNYIALLAGVLALSLLSHPFSLLILFGLLAAWCFLYLFRPADPPLVLFGRTFSDRETLGSLVLLSVFVIFLTFVGSLISALMKLSAENSPHIAGAVMNDGHRPGPDPAPAPHLQPPFRCWRRHRPLRHHQQRCRPDHHPGFLPLPLSPI